MIKEVRCGDKMVSRLVRTKRRALENGAETLLTKPIDFGILRSEIDSRVGSAA